MPPAYNEKTGGVVSRYIILANSKQAFILSRCFIQMVGSQYLNYINSNCLNRSDKNSGAFTGA